MEKQSIVPKQQRGIGKMKLEWIRCPLCGSKTRNRIREDTILKNYPLYCLKCKQEVLVEAKDL